MDARVFISMFDILGIRAAWGLALALVCPEIAAKASKRCSRHTFSVGSILRSCRAALAWTSGAVPSQCNFIADPRGGGDAVHGVTIPLRLLHPLFQR